MHAPSRTAWTRLTCISLVAFWTMTSARALGGDDEQVLKKLQDFDSYMEKVLKDWNAPGVGVGIVVKDKLVFAKGYGYRDYGKKLPFTPTTLCQIASN